jgi:uncharacterized lipoprotein YmbA
MKNLFLLVVVALLLAGCEKEAQVASYNLSVAADQFQIDRRIVFYDAIQGTYLLSIEGRCSIKKDNADNQLEVTCKTSETEYKKHFLGISDNVTYFAEQIRQAPVSVYHYKVIFRPQTIIPDVDLKVGRG